MTPVEVLTRRGGAASWRSLMDAGVDDQQLRAALQAGKVTRPGRGLYALADADSDMLTAAGLRGRLTCVSAAQRFGLPLLNAPAHPHVAVPRNRSGRTDDAVLHRVDGRGDWRRGLLVPLPAAVATLTRCASFVEAVVVLDAALRLGRVTRSGLLRQLRGPGSVSARAAVNAADGRSGSVIETVVRLALLHAGLNVVPQVYIEGTGRVDFLVDGWLVVEIDGFAFHSERAQYREDRRRANALAAQGYVLLRFTYEDVMSNLDQVVGLVAATLARGR